MKKTLFALAPAALLLLAVSSAHASSSATLTVSGTVSATTCDLSLDRTSVPLGQTAPSGFTPGTIRAAGQQTVTLTIAACESTPGATDTARLQVTGTALNANTAIFNNDMFTNVGIMVMNGSTPVANGSVIPVATGPTIDGATQNLTVGFASTAVAATPGLVNAAIMFNLLVS